MQGPNRVPEIIGNLTASDADARAQCVQTIQWQHRTVDPSQYSLQPQRFELN